jgi:hypothetical protein
VATAWTVPGLKEALAKERRLRENAYLGFPEIVCGVKLHQITPRLLAILFRMESPYLDGGSITPTETLRLMWALSIDFTKDRKYRDKWIAKYVKWLEKKEYDWEYVHDEVFEYLDATFLDAPQGSDSTPYVCSLAWYEFRMKRMMGWDSERTMETPLRRIYQLMRCEQITEGDRTIVNKLSDKVNDDWLNEVMKDPSKIAEIQRGGITLN